MSNFHLSLKLIFLYFHLLTLLTVYLFTAFGESTATENDCVFGKNTSIVTDAIRTHNFAYLECIKNRIDSIDAVDEKGKIFLLVAIQYKNWNFSNWLLDNTRSFSGHSSKIMGRLLADFAGYADQKRDKFNEYPDYNETDFNQYLDLIEYMASSGFEADLNYNLTSYSPYNTILHYVEFICDTKNTPIWENIGKMKYVFHFLKRISDNFDNSARFRSATFEKLEHLAKKLNLYDTVCLNTADSLFGFSKNY